MPSSAINTKKRFSSPKNSGNSGCARSATASRPRRNYYISRLHRIRISFKKPLTEKTVQTEAPKDEPQAVMSGEHMPYVDESFKEELASLSHLLAPQQPNPTTELTMADVIQFLQSYEGGGKQTSALQMENDRLKRENQELQSKTEKLEAAVEKLEKDQKTIQEDYETLVKIMNRARKLVLFEDEHASPSFKMDRNGNLEKMAE